MWNYRQRVQGASTDTLRRVHWEKEGVKDSRAWMKAG